MDVRLSTNGTVAIPYKATTTVEYTVRTVALRREEAEVRQAKRREWLRVTEADWAELEDYVASIAGLGC